MTFTSDCRILLCTPTQPQGNRAQVYPHQKWSFLFTSSGLAFSRWMGGKPKSLSMLPRDSGTREMSQAACEKTLRFSTVGKGWGQRWP